jgi:AraC-like DNA-binding protein
MNGQFVQFWQTAPRLRLAVLMSRGAPARQQFHAHSHPFFELAMVWDGVCTWRLPGQRWRLRAGDVLLVPPGARHWEQVPKRAVTRLGWIGFDFADAAVTAPAELLRPLAAGALAPEIRRLYSIIYEEHQAQALGSRERAGLALHELLILLCRLPTLRLNATPVLPGSQRRQRRAQLAGAAAQTLIGNLTQPLRVRDLARYHALSPGRFSTVFRQHHGVGPRGFLQAARVQQVKALLTEGDKPLKDIAATCGYTDAAHLCRAFKRATGTPPGHWRRERRLGAPPSPAAPGKKL